VLLCSYVCYSLYRVFPRKKRKPENCHIPGRDSHHPDLAGVVCHNVEELNYIKCPKYIKCPTIGLVHKARIYDSDTMTPNKQEGRLKEHLGKVVYLRTSDDVLWGLTRS